MTSPSITEKTSPSINENKHLVNSYLKALSGRPKTRELVERYVSDPRLLEHIRAIEAAFPEYELIVEEIIAERDLVVVSGTFRGIHRGPFCGIDPSGRSVSAGLIIVYRIADGLIAQHRLQFDTLGLIEQLKQTLPAVSA